MYSKFETGYLVALAFTARLAFDKGEDSHELFSNPGGDISDVVDAADLKERLAQAGYWQELEEDLKGFYESAVPILEIAGNPLSWERVGSDFLFTRNGHGAGFWDRGIGDVGEQLTQLCKPYGSAELEAYPKEGASIDPAAPDLDCLVLQIIH